MSHLRAPAARADRREGGRHGRPAPRTASTPAETPLRPQLLRLAVLPPVAVALAGCAAVLFTVRSTGTLPTPTLWGVLAGALGVAVAGVLTAAVAAGRAADSVKERVDTLRRTATRGEAELRALVEALRRGETVPKRGGRGRPAADTSGADDFELLAADLARARDGAVAAVVRAAQLSSRAGIEQKLEVFLNLARRLQSLVHREISTLDELENEIEDPDLLKGLFHVDHLSTRIRRHAENLAVLGGAVSRRQWSNPVEMTEVLRSAIAEVEQYSRVRLVPPVDGRLRGHAVADVIHLLAELVENATVFSAPHTQVLLRANLVTAGLAVEVEDRGLGMPLAEQHRMNALLADPDQVNVASLLQDGRIGLYVVSQLARRHGIQVRLGTNIYGGVQAVLVLPAEVLGAPRPELSPTAQPAAPAVGGAPGSVEAGDSGGAPSPDGMPAPGGASGRVPGAARPEGWAGQGSTEPTHPGEPAPTAAPPAGRRAVEPDGPDAGVPGVGGTPPGPGAVGTGAPAPGTPDEGPPVDASGSGGRGMPAPSAFRPDAPGFGAPEPGVTGSHGSAPGATPMGAGADVSHAGPGTPLGAAPPLPVRGQRAARPNPADAQPGIGAGHRRLLAENTVLPTPRVGPVRGTMGKPKLPRRRAQEHLAPQLRGGPVPGPREDTGEYAEHDPGLMAAFQRGIGLAEAQAPSTEPSEPLEPPRPAEPPRPTPGGPAEPSHPASALPAEPPHQAPPAPGEPFDLASGGLVESSRPASAVPGESSRQAPPEWSEPSRRAVGGSAEPLRPASGGPAELSRPASAALGEPLPQAPTGAGESFHPASGGPAELSRPASAALGEPLPQVPTGSGEPFYPVLGGSAESSRPVSAAPGEPLHQIPTGSGEPFYPASGGLVEPSRPASAALGESSRQAPPEWSEPSRRAVGGSAEPLRPAVGGLAGPSRPASALPGELPRQAPTGSGEPPRQAPTGSGEPFHLVVGGPVEPLRPAVGGLVEPSPPASALPGEPSHPAPTLHPVGVPAEPHRPASGAPDEPSHAAPAPAAEPHGSVGTGGDAIAGGRAASEGAGWRDGSASAG
ncbi:MULTISPECIES: ATP-binding protein [unclassified Streptomyces]|uniref:sensor histidine kinase n=1 Tax=unclassified Streptomyces TaxID=2593676 RepID=UPI000A661F2F